MRIKQLILPLLLACPAHVSAQAFNILTLPQNSTTNRNETFVTVSEAADLRATIQKLTRFRTEHVQAVAALMEPTLKSYSLPLWSRVSVLWGPSAEGGQIPYRIKVEIPRAEDGLLEPRVTVALNDNGEFVLAAEPPEGDQPKDGRTDRR